MSPPVPSISVITVVRNGAAHLGQCLDSVAGQRGIAFEHIVIDGGSTDGSVDLIRQREQRLAFWVSEPDRGIGDAMNKGIARARAAWLLFLHADDYLISETALRDCCQVLSVSDAEIVGFPVHYGSPETHRRLNPRGGGWWLNLKTGLLHQGSFIRRRLFERIGAYDLQFRIAMDYDFFLRARRAGASIATSQACVPSLMRDTGLSGRTDPASLRDRFAEERRIHRLHANSWLARVGYAAYWLCYPSYRRLRA